MGDVLEFGEGALERALKDPAACRRFLCFLATNHRYEFLTSPLVMSTADVLKTTRQVYEFLKSEEERGPDSGRRDH
jgi:hypothetical protein